MKAKEIKQGCRYTDGRGSVREVIKIGPEISTEYIPCLFYKNIKIDPQTGRGREGYEKRCLVTQFARWARTRDWSPSEVPAPKSPFKLGPKSIHWSLRVEFLKGRHELDDVEKIEIARLIREGCVAGRLDREDESD